MRNKWINLILVLCFSSGLISAQEKPIQINHSRIAFTLSEKDLLPENIAYDAKTQSFFVGSTRKGKVIKIDANGRHSDFINPKQDGLWMVIGMKVDSNNRWLWVCSSGGDNLEGYNFKDDMQGRPAGIFKFDLDSGKLIKKYILEDKGNVYFFNDLVIDAEGNVYITHMFKEHAIYSIQKNKDILEVFVKPKVLKYPNGITITDDNQFLFVAHSEGLLRVNIKSKEVKPVKLPESLNIARRESIDGLYFYKNALIGIRPSAKQVQKFILNQSLDTIESNLILEANHPMMNTPTTGVIVNEELYYIANAQFGSFDAEGHLFPMENLYEPTILNINLNAINTISNEKQ